MLPEVQAFMLDRYHVDCPNFTPVSLNVNGKWSRIKSAILGSVWKGIQSDISPPISDMARTRTFSLTASSVSKMANSCKLWKTMEFIPLELEYMSIERGIFC